MGEGVKISKRKDNRKKEQEDILRYYVDKIEKRKH
jgi:hypothetical protein